MPQTPARRQRRAGRKTKEKPFRLLFFDMIETTIPSINMQSQSDFDGFCRQADQRQDPVFDSVKVGVRRTVPRPVVNIQYGNVFVMPCFFIVCSMACAYRIGMALCIFESAFAVYQLIQRKALILRRRAAVDVVTVSKTDLNICQIVKTGVVVHGKRDVPSLDFDRAVLGNRKGSHQSSGAGIVVIQIQINRGRAGIDLL